LLKHRNFFKKFLQKLIKSIVYLLLKIFFRLEVIGQDKVPLNGPLIIIANHHSYLDPPVLTVSTPRDVSFVAKKELFSTPIISFFVKLYDSIEVDRENTKPSTFKAIFKTLSEEKAIGIFPEGSRIKDPTKFGQSEKGLNLIISKFKAPILITYIDGTYQWYKKFKIKVIFKELISIENLEKLMKETNSEEIAQLLMKKVYHNEHKT